MQHWSDRYLKQTGSMLDVGSKEFIRDEVSTVILGISVCAHTKSSKATRGWMLVLFMLNRSPFKWECLYSKEEMLTNWGNMTLSGPKKSHDQTICNFLDCCRRFSCRYNIHQSFLRTHSASCLISQSRHDHYLKAGCIVRSQWTWS